MKAVMDRLWVATMLALIGNILEDVFVNGQHWALLG